MAEPNAGALRLAIVGAESTGKSTLAQALAQRLAQDTGLRVAAVGEVLREWCAQAGRTPRRDEQAAIALSQQRRIEQAAGCHDIVVCDTTPLMTAVYSWLVFGDTSLDAEAVALHRGVHATLLTSIDLPWVAEHGLRDGPQVRVPVDDRLRGLLRGHGLPFAVVGGQGPARLQQALAATAPLLRRRALNAGRARPPADARAG